jgi:hypothetical protein
VAHRRPKPVHRLWHHLGGDSDPRPDQAGPPSPRLASGGSIPEGYWRLCRLWLIWGTIATLLPLANLYFMVVKPN